jgi:DNA-binding transcriptional LysR family regulator
MKMDRLAAMETFVRVIEAGSFSGAAKQLHIGQPAVSKAIAQLEDRLGVRVLLLRSTHGLSPASLALRDQVEHEAALREVFARFLPHATSSGRSGSGRRQLFVGLRDAQHFGKAEGESR